MEDFYFKDADIQLGTEIVIAKTRAVIKGTVSGSWHGYFWIDSKTYLRKISPGDWCILIGETGQEFDIKIDQLRGNSVTFIDGKQR